MTLAFLTVCEMLPVLVKWPESPLYTAEMVWLPTVTVLVAATHGLASAVERDRRAEVDAANLELDGAGRRAAA